MSSPAHSVTRSIGGRMVRYDVVDEHLVLARTWSLHRTGRGVYLSAMDYSGERPRRLYLHREIVGGAARVVDHANGDTLDNRRTNLRACSYSQNSANSRDRRRRSGFRGVVKQSRARTFTARIKVNYQPIYLGSFATEEEAARAYDVAARQHFPEVACG